MRSEPRVPHVAAEAARTKQRSMIPWKDASPDPRFRREARRMDR